MIEPTNGEKITINGLDCYMPEPPPIYEIENSHLPVAEQKWFRTPILSIKVRDIEIFSGDRYTSNTMLEWDTARREEIIKQSGADPWDLDRLGDPKPVPGIIADPTFEFEVMKYYRQRELERCDPWTGGHWVMINGKPVYITPFHYFYIQWWKINIGYPEWRWTDALRFYHWQYAWEDENSLGRTEISKRGDGKSYRGGAITYLGTVFQRNVMSGIQSKTGPDAASLFSKKIVEPYKDLPDFLVPINSNSTDPQERLRFFAAGKRGKSSAFHRLQQKLAIRSEVEFRSSRANAYNGETVAGIFFRDEEGNTEMAECDVNERHTITRDCVYRDGEVFGKIYSTTKMGEMMKGGHNYKMIWDDSNPTERNELGETRSGLYKLFLPAYLTEYQNEYGYPDEEKARRYQTARRKSYEGNPLAYQNYVLQYPWSEQECFASLGSNCQYNYRVLAERQREILDPSFQREFVRKGRFEFVDETDFSAGTLWIEDPEGPWHTTEILVGDQKDQVYKVDHGGVITFRPKNVEKYVGGFDPTKTTANPDKRRSKAGGSIYKFADFFKPDDMNQDNFVADFVYQPDDPEVAYMMFLAGLWHFGCMALIESNLGIAPTYKNAGCKDFIMKRPEYTYKDTRKANPNEEGLPAGDITNDLLMKNSKSWANREVDGVPFYNSKRINLPRTIADMIMYDPQMRTKFDLEVAKQNALMGAKKEVYKPTQTVKFEELFMTFDNSKSFGTIN